MRKYSTVKKLKKLLNGCKLRKSLTCIGFSLAYILINNYLVLIERINSHHEHHGPFDVEQSKNPEQFYLDPEDLIVAPFINYDKRFVYDNEYFSENESLLSIGNTSKTQCIHPYLNPYDKDIMKFVVKPKYKITCNPKKNWIYIENGTVCLAKEALEIHDGIQCGYIPLYRDNDDFRVREGYKIFPISDRMPLITDFFKIDCRSKDGSVYSNIHRYAVKSLLIKCKHILHV